MGKFSKESEDFLQHGKSGQTLQIFSSRFSIICKWEKALSVSCHPWLCVQTEITTEPWTIITVGTISFVRSIIYGRDSRPPENKKETRGEFEKHANAKRKRYESHGCTRVVYFTGFYGSSMVRERRNEFVLHARLHDERTGDELSSVTGVKGGPLLILVLAAAGLCWAWLYYISCPLFFFRTVSLLRRKQKRAGKTLQVKKTMMLKSRFQSQALEDSHPSHHRVLFWNFSCSKNILPTLLYAVRVQISSWAKAIAPSEIATAIPILSTRREFYGNFYHTYKEG